LEERIDAVGTLIVRREGYGFYDVEREERGDIVDFAAVFGNDNPTHLEIGCGKGGFVRKMAGLFPNVNFVAVEKLSNVIIEACEKVALDGVTNVRFLNCGAENLLCYVQPHTVGTIYLNFSCPYPKKTYANRRLTSERYLTIYKELLTDDGVIKLKTDNRDFFINSKEMLTQCGFALFDVTEDLHHSEYAVGNVITEYEERFASQGWQIYALKAKLII
jgi:tRNA (guanine-N7-)-methyltransferase